MKRHSLTVLDDVINNEHSLAVHDDDVNEEPVQGCECTHTERELAMKIFQS
jgi:hypothetical protein